MGEEIEGKKGPYPKSVFLIVGNEFCERFSYFGMRTILVIFLSNILMYDDDSSKSIYHGFVMACYFMPLFGAIISDSWLGKFKTIFYISIIYCIGNIVLSVGALNFSLSVQRGLSIFGLILIACGTGGIKPCVAAFGGDQFNPGQELYLAQFFSLFYICINAGSTISTAITPILRVMPCDGQDSCFPLAFAVPALLMIVSVVLFVSGKKYYKMSPPGENVLVNMVKCIGSAVSTRVKSGKDETKTHWLDYADDRFDRKFLEDVKTVLRVLFLYIPVPLFWSLYDQQGSSWTLQASRMKWSVFGIPLIAEQVQLLNPIFILILAPLFSYVVYPALNKVGLLKKPLQKMVVGGLFSAAAFFYCMFLQIAVEAQSSNSLTLINTLPCNLTLHYKADSGTVNKIVHDRYGIYRMDRPLPSFVKMTPDEKNPECKAIKPFEYTVSNSFKQDREKIITFSGSQIKVLDIPELDHGGVADLKALVFGNTSDLEISPPHGDSVKFTIAKGLDLPNDLNLYRAEVKADSGKYEVHDSTRNCSSVSLENDIGYTYVLFDDECQHGRTRDVPTISLMYQAPQYILITVGEVLFSITGLEFAYSQSPDSMKSVLQAAWSMTVAFGNLLDVVVASIGMERQSNEFLLFGGAMIVDMVVFAVFAYFYVPIKKEEDDEEVGVEAVEQHL